MVVFWGNLTRCTLNISISFGDKCQCFALPSNLSFQKVVESPRKKFGDRSHGCKGLEKTLATQIC